ncbi:MAG: prepilin-type N-terminal cleavage/methylation domain-containing protein [Verrucomicrobiia bacterium]
MRSVRQRPRATPRRAEAGFLLLEVLVAVFLLAICVFGLLECLGRCVAAARSIQSYTVSDILLANKSYEFRTERPTDILDQEGKFDDYPGYSWSRKFERTDTTGLWEQTITVYWYERGKEVSESIVDYRYLPDKEQ